MTLSDPITARMTCRRKRRSRSRKLHEWASTETDTVRAGRTGFAQDELGDVVFVELPSIGESVTQGDAFGVVESINTVSDLYSPVSEEVVSINKTLFDQPELVNEKSYEDGWMLEDAVDSPEEFNDLLTPAEYDDQII